MKHLFKFQPGWLLATGVGAGLLLSLIAGFLFESASRPAYGQQETRPKLSDLIDPEPEAGISSVRLPDQSHAMTDVGYHFANLWFAADRQNWPLANYYLSETRSHLRWAVAIHPVRKTKAGADVDLKGILDAVDNTFLAEIGKEIETKDTEKFKVAYRQVIEGCYACHKACEKPFLRPQVPTAANFPILNFDPHAIWPE